MTIAALMKEGLVMRIGLANHKWLPAYSAVLLIFGGFIAGATILTRAEAHDGATRSDLPADWLAGALDTVLGVILIGVPLIIGAVLRFFAYRRFERRWDSRLGFVVPVIAFETLVFVPALWLVFSATGPEEGAGWMWLFYTYLGLAVLVVSLVILLGSLLVKPPVREETPA